MYKKMYFICLYTQIVVTFSLVYIIVSNLNTILSINCFNIKYLYIDYIYIYNLKNTQYK